MFIDWICSWGEWRGPFYFFTRNHLANSILSGQEVSFNEGGTHLEPFFSQKQYDDFNSFLFSISLCTGITKNLLMLVFGLKMFRWAVWPMGLLFKWCAFDVHFQFLILFLVFQPCRFGMQCMNKSSCTFFHPPVPSKSQLKWTAISKQTSTHIRYAKQKFSHLLHAIFATNGSGLHTRRREWEA